MSRKVELGMGTVWGWRGALLSRAFQRRASLSRALLASAMVLAAACGDDFTPATTGGAAGGGSAECTAGAVGDCYGGAEGTEGVGACKAGTRICGSDGAWGACEGAVEPVPETCATAEDDDCDGETNEEGEGCDCVPAASEPCYGGAEGTEGVGPCVGGTRTCGSDGKWGACDGETVPGVEDCDAGLVDEDCDGELNEDGAACVCTISSSQDCYSGDAATKDVGNCKHGTEACNAIGTAYEACMGEVLPATEDCYVKGDEDCNGNPCSDAIFNVGFGGTMAGAIIKDVAFDSAGNVIAVGTFSGTVTVGNANYVGNGYDALIVKFDKTGAVLWSQKVGGTGADGFNAVAVGSADNIFVAGGYASPLTLGGSPLPFAAQAIQGGMVVKYDAAGTLKAARGKSVAYGVVTYHDIAVSSAGEVVAAGGFTGKYHDGQFYVDYLGSDSYEEFLDEALTYKTSGSWGAAGDQAITSVAYGPDGLYVAGIFDTSINVGTLQTTSYDDDAFVAKLGNGGWVKRYYTKATDVKIAIDAVGNVGVGVSFTNSITPFLTTPSKGLGDVMLAIYDKGGVYKSAKTYGDSANQLVTGLAFDSQAKLLATGWFVGTIDFGGKALTTVPINGFLAKLDWVADTLAWSKAADSPGTGYGPNSVASAPDGRIAVGGSFSGSLNLGLDPVTSKGTFDGVVAVFNP